MQWPAGVITPDLSYETLGDWLISSELKLDNFVCLLFCKFDIFIYLLPLEFRLFRIWTVFVFIFTWKALDEEICLYLRSWGKFSFEFRAFICLSLELLNELLPLQLYCSQLPYCRLRFTLARLNDITEQVLMLFICFWTRLAKFGELLIFSKNSFGSTIDKLGLYTIFFLLLLYFIRKSTGDLVEFLIISLQLLNFASISAESCYEKFGECDLLL